MNAWLSSLSRFLWPSTDMVESHSSPLSTGTMAKSGRFHARGGAHILEQLPVEGQQARHGVSVERRVHLEGHQVIDGLEAGVGLLQIGQRPHEESGADQQEEGKRHLRGDQRLAQPDRAAAAGNRAHHILQRVPQIHLERLQRRRQAEQHAGEQGEHAVEGQDAQVRLRPQHQRGRVAGEEVQQSADDGHGQEQARPRRRSGRARGFRSTTGAATASARRPRPAARPLPSAARWRGQSSDWPR